jgi:quercetin dioxygenase-like cupin family protein
MNRKIWRRGGIATTAAVSALVAAGLVTQTGTRRASQPGHDAGRSPDHVMLTEDDLQWKEGPPSLPRGAQVAMMEGDPSKAGPFTMRVKFPPDYHIPAHTHPAIEHVTVISGTFHMGTGNKLDTSKGKELKHGGFALMAVGTEHFAWTGDQEAVVQLHGMGPWDIYYLDPATDPRNNR